MLLIHKEQDFLIYDILLDRYHIEHISYQIRTLPQHYIDITYFLFDSHTNETMKMKSRLILPLVLLFLVRLSVEKSVLSENGYTNLVGAISPDVPESQVPLYLRFPFPNFNDSTQGTIDQIKHLMTEASRELMIASRHRAYFKQVKILLPKTWTSVPHDQTLQGEFFEDAEIRVDR